MGSLLLIFGMICLIIIFFKLILCEIDGRRANKQYNLRYFLSYTAPFKYTKARSMFFFSLLCFVLVSDINLFSLTGLYYFALFFVLSILMDIVSQYAYYFYGKHRFKIGINKAAKVKEILNKAQDVEDIEHIKYPDNKFSFEEICESYFKEDYHIAITSMDGGSFANRLKNIPYVTFLIDHFENRAKNLLADKNIKVTTLTTSNSLPFKEDKLDMYIVNYSNFNKEDVHKVLKPDGLLLLRHKGNEDMKEVSFSAIASIQKRNQWNSRVCADILTNNGFTIIDSKEVNDHVEFYTIESFITYLKDGQTDEKINVDLYLNQLAFIDANIKQKGKFTVTFHEFYIIAKKN